jgi:HlyD family secretion protein
MAKKSITRGLKWLVALAVIGGGAYYGYSRYEQAKLKPPEYRTATIGRGEIIQMVTANGGVSPVTNITVGSQVSGIITELNVDFNSRVTNGQVIAQIDPSTYSRLVTQAKAQLANAKAGLELTRVNYERSTNLFAEKLIAAADNDKALADLHQAEAEVQMNEANLEKTKVDLGYTTITAPIDGIIISRAVEVGQTVASSFNTPTLFQIANDLKRMRIEAMVSEADVGGVKEGQTVNFTVDAYTGQQFDGIVSQVRFAPITNQNVVNYSVMVSVNNDDLRLRPGMTANASIVTAKKSGVLRVPNAALRFRPPDNAIVLSNAVSKVTGSKDTNPVVVVAGGEAPQRGGRGSMDPEERKRRFEAMSPEERERAMARMRERFGGNLPPGMMGGGATRPDAPTTQTVYLIDKQEGSDVRLKPVTVKVGITDGAFTEVLDGLKEGDVVASGVALPASATATLRPGSSPFGGPFGGGRR